MQHIQQYGVVRLLQGSLNLRLEPVFHQTSYHAEDDPLTYLLLDLEVKGSENTAAPPRISADIFLVLDVSGSMNAPDRYPLLCQAVSEFLSQMEPDDRVGIAVFSTEAELITPLLSGAEAARRTPEILKRMDSSRLKFGGGTYLAPGLMQAREIIGGQSQKRVRRVYILTDGALHDPQVCQQALIPFRDDQLEVHVYGFGSAFDGAALRNLVSDQLGGSVKPICNKQDIIHTFAHIAEVNRRLVAQEAVLTLEFSPELDCGDAWAFRPQERYLGRIHERRLVREIGALEAERVYSFLLELRLPPAPGALKSFLARASLSWREGDAPGEAEVHLAAPRSDKDDGALVPRVHEALQILDSLRREGDKEAERVAARARLELAQKEGRDPGLLEALQKQLDVLEGRAPAQALSQADAQYLASDFSTAAGS